MSTEAISNEKRSTLSLVDEIKLKLAQANAICNATRQAQGAHTDDTVAYALLAATDLIEDSMKAFDELWKTHDFTQREAPRVGAARGSLA